MQSSSVLFIRPKVWLRSASLAIQLSWKTGVFPTSLPSNQKERQNSQPQAFLLNPIGFRQKNNSAEKEESVSIQRPLFRSSDVIQGKSSGPKQFLIQRFVFPVQTVHSVILLICNTFSFSGRIKNDETVTFMLAQCHLVDVRLGPRSTTGER